VAAFSYFGVGGQPVWGDSGKQLRLRDEAEGIIGAVICNRNGRRSLLISSDS